MQWIGDKPRRAGTARASLVADDHSLILADRGLADLGDAAHLVDDAGDLEHARHRRAGCALEDAPGLPRLDPCPRPLVEMKNQRALFPIRRHDPTLHTGLA